jgi:hypothetical protein
VSGFSRVIAAGTTVDILKESVANFTATSGDNTSVQGFAIIPLA